MSEMKRSIVTVDDLRLDKTKQVTFEDLGEGDFFEYRAGMLCVKLGGEEYMDIVDGTCYDIEDEESIVLPLHVKITVVG